MAGGVSGRPAALVVVALLMVAGAGRSSAAAHLPKRVGEAGVYVVSSCGIVGRGATEAAARGAFKRAVHEARRGWPNMSPRCASLTLTDVVRLAPGQKPAFFVAGSTEIQGPNPQETARRCRADERARQAAEPNVDQRADCDWVRAVYGPFARKRGWDELDDPGRYVFLDDEGKWVDDRGEPICFPAGTPIATPAGDRPIEELTAGSAVLSWSIARGAPVVARVLAVKRRHARELLELTLADGLTLRVSANHPLYLPARADWVAAGELRPGDRLGVLADGRLAPVAIDAIATRTVDTDVFDLTIETTHAYFAGGVLAHNY
jgi:hypothetical protein